MNIWFSSDHHFYHNNVIRYCSRPYSSVEEMNEALVRNWNDVVRPDDIVYYLGDFSMAFRSVELFTNRLMGHKILICGNHDFCHPAHKRSRNEANRALWTQKYLDNGWAEVHTYIEYDIPGVAKVNMMHLPYYDEFGKYEAHRMKDDGRWLFCGHVHEKWKTKDKMINVGVDVWDYKPVHIDEIKRIILNGNF